MSPEQDGRCTAERRLVPRGSCLGVSFAGTGIAARAICAALAASAVLGAVAPVAAAQGAILRGSIEGADCDTVEVVGPTLGQARTVPREDGTFEMRVPVEEAGYCVLRCGESIALFLSPDDSLEIATAGGRTARFTGRGAEANQLIADMARLRDEHGGSLLRSYFELTALPEEAFVAAWDSAYAVLLDPLSMRIAQYEVPALVAKVERAKVIYPWAEGCVRYPFLHWRATGTDVMSISDRPGDCLSSLDLNDASLLALEEYTSFLGAHVHEQARRIRKKELSLASGDNQWTRAEYEVAVRMFTDEAVRNHVLHSILAQHLDRYGSKGLEGLLARFRSDCSDERFVAEIGDAYTKDRTYWEGHDTEVYKTVDGIDLDVHLFRPGDLLSGRRAALVWFHGGSWSEGAWYWCLGLCGRFVSEGMVVIQVEYRVHDRHGTTPLESVADAKSAIRWVRANADRLGVDPDRIVAAGFSAGGHLAAACAVLEGFDEPGEDRMVSTQPDAVILASACVDPTQDPWYRRIVGGKGAPEDGSPAHHVRPGLPPMLALHGTGDRMCPFPVLAEFAGRMREAGNTLEVEAFEGRPHFFLWQSREDRARALDRTVAFLDSLGFVTRGSRPRTGLKPRINR